MWNGVYAYIYTCKYIYTFAYSVYATNVEFILQQFWTIFADF